NLPVLGICRGMQIMAVALGGRLKQSIGGLPDHPALDSLSGEEILALRHPVTLQPGSRLASLYGQSEVLVNTIHHQAVREAGQWQITGYGSGDLIEALEANDDWPALGVQWHPEKLVPGQEEHLFAYLVHEAENYARTKQPGTSKGEGA
ncbi:MAG TPA: gamma-glutamyl-gamma-aminobutyrate hydrolase family protein, partial [Ktedonobacteraceae bacterium]|nr:gamma-glutamyl-gamma-aminobutyrate hydrolase family protein [Ktedonobacteraceae bacterium]